MGRLMTAFFLCLDKRAGADRVSGFAEKFKQRIRACKALLRTSQHLQERIACATIQVRFAHGIRACKALLRTSLHL